MLKFNANIDVEANANVKCEQALTHGCCKSGNVSNMILYLIAGDKDENETEKYCGSDKPDYQVIYNDTVEVTFSSDFSVQYSGFTLKYMLSKILTKA